MKKSLEWLKARSAKIVLQQKAVEIAKEANSPTDAFHLAKSSGYFDEYDAESVRYLAIIKRDYGSLEFDSFVRSSCNASLVKSFFDMLTAAISVVEFSELCPEILQKPEVSNKIGPLLLEIRRIFDSEFLVLISNSDSASSIRCKDYYGKYVYMFDFFVKISDADPGYYDKYCFEKIFILLLNMGWSVGEQYGVYFMMTPPARVLRDL